MAVDGVSGVEMITALHDAEVGVDEAEMVDDWSPEPDPSALALIQKALLSSAGKPLRLARVIRDKAPAIPRVIRGVRGGEIGALLASRSPRLTRPSRRTGPSALTDCRWHR